MKHEFEHDHEKLGEILADGFLYSDSHGAEVRKQLSKAIGYLGAIVSSEWDFDPSENIQDALSAAAGALSHYEFVEKGLDNVARYYEGHKVPSDNEVAHARREVERMMGDQTRDTVARVADRAAEKKAPKLNRKDDLSLWAANNEVVTEALPNLQVTAKEVIQALGVYIEHPVDDLDGLKCSLERMARSLLDLEHVEELTEQASALFGESEAES